MHICGLYPHMRLFANQELDKEWTRYSPVSTARKKTSTFFDRPAAKYSGNFFRTYPKHWMAKSSWPLPKCKGRFTVVTYILVICWKQSRLRNPWAVVLRVSLCWKNRKILKKLSYNCHLKKFLKIVFHANVLNTRGNTIWSTCILSIWQGSCEYHRIT